MKKYYLLLCFFFLCANTFAHDSAIPLESGELRVSLYPSISGGASYSTSILFDDEMNPSGVVLQALTSEYDFSIGGDVTKVEWGLTDFMALGIDLGLLNFFYLRALSGNWILYTAPYFRIDLPQAVLNIHRINLHFVSKCFFSPIFSFPGKSAWMGDGLINLFNTISFNYLLIEKQNFKWHGYIDFKNITSFINEIYNPRPINLSALIPDEYFSPEELAELTVENGVLHKVAICPGVEFSWGWFNIYLGLNLKLFQYSVNPGSFAGIAMSIRDISPSNLELGWNFKF